MAGRNEIPFESWYAVNADDTMVLAENERKRMSIPWRIWEIATARMNNWGHAPFKPGDLVTLVCGADSRSDKAAVNRGLDTLAAMGRIVPRYQQPGSSILCIVVNTRYAIRRAGRPQEFLCWEPTHADYRKIAYQK